MLYRIYCTTHINCFFFPNLAESLVSWVLVPVCYHCIKRVCAESMCQYFQVEVEWITAGYVTSFCFCFATRTWCCHPALLKMFSSRFLPAAENPICKNNRLSWPQLLRVWKHISAFLQAGRECCHMRGDISVVVTIAIMVAREFQQKQKRKWESLQVYWFIYG